MIFHPQFKMYVSNIYIYLFILHGYITYSQHDQLPIGLIAQLAEHYTGIAEVMGSNPVQATFFFQAFFSQLLKLRSVTARIFLLFDLSSAVQNICSSNIYIKIDNSWQRELLKRAVYQRVRISERNTDVRFVLSWPRHFRKVLKIRSFVTFANW